VPVIPKLATREKEAIMASAAIPAKSDRQENWLTLIGACETSWLLALYSWMAWLHAMSTQEPSHHAYHEEHDQLELPEPFEVDTEPCLFA
jgi:NADH:ubiquinone oxidoreductase subunit